MHRNMSLGPNGVNRNVFVAKNSDATSWHELLHQFGPFCTEFCKAIKRSQMHPNSTNTHQNTSLDPNGVNRVRSLQKIPTRLHRTNFCTTSARFARSFVRQPNSPKCSQIVQNTPKYVFRIQWGGSSVFIAKNSDSISWHELLQHFGPFCTECCNATKLSQMHSNSTNSTKHEVRVQWGG